MLPIQYHSARFPAVFAVRCYRLALGPYRLAPRDDRDGNDLGSETEKGGPSTWCARIRKKRGGRVVLSISQTFERERDLKKTKSRALRAIREDDIASMACEDIRSDHLVAFAKGLLDGDGAPSTVGNYMWHLSSVFAIARPAWGYPLDEGAMKDAMTVCKRLGYIAKSKQRGRRPTQDELDKLMAHFVERSQRRRRSAPQAQDHCHGSLLDQARERDLWSLLE